MSDNKENHNHTEELKCSFCGKTQEQVKKLIAGPDVFMIPSDRVGYAVVQGLISPVLFMVEDQDKYIFSAVSSFMQDGDIYGVPKSVETLVMFYNKDLLKKPFDTMDEYFDYSKKIHQENEEQYGLLAKFDTLYYVFGLLHSYGAYVFGEDPDGNLNAEDIGLANDGAVMGMEYVKKFYDHKVFPSSTIGDQGLTVMDDIFIAGKAAAIINGPWALEPYKNSGITYGISPLPVLPNGRPMSSFLGVKGYVVSTWARDHELAEAFLRFINQAKYAKERFTITNEIPPVKAVMVDPDITNNPIANAIAVQASRSVPMPSIPEISEVWAPVDMSLQSIVTDRLNVRDGLRSAVEQVDYQIDAFRSGY